MGRWASDLTTAVVKMLKLQLRGSCGVNNCRVVHGCNILSSSSCIFSEKRSNPALKIEMF